MNKIWRGMVVKNYIEQEDLEVSNGIKGKED